MPTFGKQWTLRTYHHEHRVEKVSLNVAKEGVFRDDLPEELPSRRSVDLLKQRKGPSLQCAPCINFSQQISLLFGITGLTCSRRAKYVEASPHTGHPCFFVKNKGSLRAVVDYRALNRLTKRNHSPLPRTDEMFDRLGKARVFSKLDLKTGFHQIRVRPKDIEKNAFNTKYGQFEYLVLPMGLCNAPATFQSLMNEVLHDCIE